jgi:ketosteroid isomerase-like protein
MAIELPRIVADYFAADQESGVEAVSGCFTADAVVMDEGKTYTGLDEIRRWKADSATKYTYTVEPFQVAAEADRTVVKAHLVGNFPGSPADLRYFFALIGGKIAALEIKP